MSPRSTVRLFVLFALLLTLTLRGATAAPLVPVVDDGGAGGSALQTPELTGSTAERETVAQADGPVLIGSTAERETVAADSDIIVASDYDEQQGRPLQTVEIASGPAPSDAEMVRGGLSPVTTDEVAGIEAREIAGQAEVADTHGELTINGVTHQ